MKEAENTHKLQERLENYTNKYSEAVAEDAPNFVRQRPVTLNEVQSITKGKVSFRRNSVFHKEGEPHTVIMSRKSSMDGSVLSALEARADLTKMEPKVVREYVRKSIVNLGEQCNDYNSITKEEFEVHENELAETQIQQDQEAILIDQLQEMAHVNPSIMNKVVKNEHEKRWNCEGKGLEVQKDVMQEYKHEKVDLSRPIIVWEKTVQNRMRKRMVREIRKNSEMLTRAAASMRKN